jgi:hypothetical protein
MCGQLLKPLLYDNDDDDRNAKLPSLLFVGKLKN